MGVFIKSKSASADQRQEGAWGWMKIAKVISEGDAHITRGLGIGTPKTRECPYHSNTFSPFSIAKFVALKNFHFPPFPLAPLVPLPLFSRDPTPKLNPHVFYSLPLAFSSPEPLGLICNRPRDQETIGSGDENASAPAVKRLDQPTPRQNAMRMSTKFNIRSAFYFRSSI